MTIENRPYQDILKRYDRPHTFYYLDPPYYGYKMYRLNFEPADFKALAVTLAAVRGKFLMSINDHSEIRKLFADFHIRQVSLKYSAAHPSAGKHGTARQELLISNYE